MIKKNATDKPKTECLAPDCNEQLSFKQGKFCDDKCHKSWYWSERDRLAETKGGTGYYIRINDKTSVLVRPGQSEDDVRARMEKQITLSMAIPKGSLIKRAVSPKHYKRKI